jgi:3-hydroxybutyryl-CoA dehydrogenase
MAFVLQRIGVIGAGSMGSGIAQVAIAAGHQTVLVDVSAVQLERALAEIRSRLDRMSVKGTLSPSEAAAAMRRLTTSQSPPAQAGIADCDVVIEAAPESLDIKRELFGAIESVVRDDCILATNTSSLSVTAIAGALRRPERFIGMHFFNPVPLMRLVEVVAGLRTDGDVVAAICDLVVAWQKKPIRARSTPGFVVNRVARPFYGESFRLLEDQAASPSTIDALLRECAGFRMGAFELTDLVGQDVNETVTRTVWTALGYDPRYQPSAIQREYVEAGLLGRKCGRGFYSYAEGATRPEIPVAAPHPAPDSAIVCGSDPHLTAIVGRADLTTVGQEAAAGVAGHVELPCGGIVLTTVGRTALDHSAELDRPVVVVDRCLDPATVGLIAIAAPPGQPGEALQQAVGVLQAAGVRPCVIEDVPGLVVARVISMLVNEAADALWKGIATAADIDVAMRFGVNYPLGPLEWGDRWSARVVAEIIDNLGTGLRDPRYRTSHPLRVCATLGRQLRSVRCPGASADHHESRS